MNVIKRAGKIHDEFYALFGKERKKVVKRELQEPLGDDAF